MVEVRAVRLRPGKVVCVPAVRLPPAHVARAWGRPDAEIADAGRNHIGAAEEVPAPRVRLNGRHPGASGSVLTGHRQTAVEVSDVLLDRAADLAHVGEA